MLKKIKSALSIIAIVLSCMGLVTFSQFILEESFQTVMFGTWPAQDANRWDIVKDGTEMMEGIVGTMRGVNRSVGWIQPLAFISYGSYADSSEFYIRGLRSKIIAHDPKLFVGETIDVVINSSWRRMGRYYVTNGKLRVITATEPKMPLSVTGRVVAGPRNVYIVKIQ